MNLVCIYFIHQNKLKKDHLLFKSIHNINYKFFSKLLFLSWLCFAPTLALHPQEAGRYDHYVINDTDLIKPSEYALRRQKALDYLDSGMALFLESSKEKVRSNDVNFDFKQNNNLYYLTGINEIGVSFILFKNAFHLKNGDSTYEILFVKDRDKYSDLWINKRMGVDVAKKISKIKVVLEDIELQSVLDSILPKTKTLLYSDWGYNILMDVISRNQSNWVKDNLIKIKTKYPNLSIINNNQLFSVLRVIKSESEIKLMQKAIDISVEAHLETIKNAKLGMYEYELEAIMESVFHKRGSESPAYPSIIGSGENGCILHYTSSRRKILNQDLIVMDCGAEYHGYCADITRTIPINGRFSNEQKLIYDLVYKAQDSAIKLCRKGNQFKSPHFLAVEIISKGLKSLGIINNESEYGQYFMHGTSHYLGLDVHDVGSTKILLDEGMIITVEPGIYIANDSPCDKKWWNISVRIEDDILITKDNPIIMSEKLPRISTEIEKIMKKNL